MSELDRSDISEHSALTERTSSSAAGTKGTNHTTRRSIRVIAKPRGTCRGGRGKARSGLTQLTNTTQSTVTEASHFKKWLSKRKKPETSPDASSSQKNPKIFKNPEALPSCSSAPEIHPTIELPDGTMNTDLKEALEALQNNIQNNISLSLEKFESKMDDNLLRQTNEIKRDLQKNHEEILARCVATDQRVDVLDERVKLVEDAQAEAAYFFQDDFLAKKLDSYDLRLDELERAAKKNNVIISGLKVERARAREMIVDFLDSQLQLQNCVVDVRVLLLSSVTLDSWDSKIKVRKAKKQLATNNQEIYIDNDLTVREQQIAKHLREVAKQLRSKGHTVKVNPTKLEFENAQFFWDNKKNMLRCDRKVKEIPPSVSKILKDALKEVPFRVTKGLSKPKN